MSKQFFLKKAAIHATLSYLFRIDRCEMKNVQPLLLFFAGDGCLVSLSLSFCKIQVLNRAFSRLSNI